MKFFKVIFLFIFLIKGYAQNYEICYPFNADSYCTAKYICSDEFYDGFVNLCPTYAPGAYDNFQAILVYEFNVDQANQFIDIEVGGDWWFEKMRLTLVGPFGENSDCNNPEPVRGATNFINITQNSSILNTALTDFGTYYIILSAGGLKGTANTPYIDIAFSPEKSCADQIDECESCIGSFAPIPGEKYLIGAWAKEPQAPITKVDYDQPQIYILFNDASGNPLPSAGPFYPQGAIIDGWQRIEAEFIIPANAVDIEIKLTTVGTDVLFDDVRMFPFDASMKTFVYDPVNMRLSAELDERHYATFYEYDEEGKLVRIKKETERGVMTIQETKSNASK